jgi:multiple sugar transport system permease protein
VPFAVPGLISAGIFAFTHSLLERIQIGARRHPIYVQEDRPGGILTGLVTGDVCQRGSLMAGALPGSVPMALFYSIFVEYYVSGQTGAVKG